MTVTLRYEGGRNGRTCRRRGLAGVMAIAACWVLWPWPARAQAGWTGVFADLSLGAEHAVEHDLALARYDHND